MNVRDATYSVYERMQAWIAPSLRYSQALYEDALSSHVRRGASWLDLGCGRQLLPPWRCDEELRLAARADVLVGIDADFQSIEKNETVPHRVGGNLSRLPFRASSFDLATANMVVEHLSDPGPVFREVRRVLRPGGVFLFHTPNLLGYTTVGARLVPGAFKKRLARLVEGRKEEDVFPTHYRANSESRIRELSQAAGFTVRQIRLIASSAEMIVLPPFAFLELLWIRLLLTRPMKRYRTNIIAVLERGP